MLLTNATEVSAEVNFCVLLFGLNNFKYAFKLVGGWAVYGNN